MKIAKKGTYGYRRWHQTRLMLSAVLLGGLMYYLFTLSLRVSKLPSTILTIGIVLSVVPLSLFVVMSFIASPPRLSAMPTRSSLKIAELCSMIASL